ncbi:hypothetical protein EI94DRAFT_1751710 [Lactarius quietus]|nr:hypothetical protein EI94DRAFT_1751710 [Lactarius quietus]
MAMYGRRGSILQEARQKLDLGAILRLTRQHGYATHNLSNPRIPTHGHPRAPLLHPPPRDVPVERVCTENLTPFLELLLFSSRTGLAALRETHRIFDADWHGLGVHVHWRAHSGVELRLTVQAVLDPVRTSADEGGMSWCSSQELMS